MHLFSIYRIYSNFGRVQYFTALHTTEIHILVLLRNDLGKRSAGNVLHKISYLYLFTVHETILHITIK